MTDEKSMFKRKSAAGKGDAPRNISRQFWDNYSLIDWGHNINNKSNSWLQDSFDAARNNRISDPEWSKGINSMEKPPVNDEEDDLYE